jgi:hypothetical protein
MPCPEFGLSRALGRIRDMQAYAGAPRFRFRLDARQARLRSILLGSRLRFGSGSTLTKAKSFNLKHVPFGC